MNCAAAMNRQRSTTKGDSTVGTIRRDSSKESSGTDISRIGIGSPIIYPSSFFCVIVLFHGARKSDWNFDDYLGGIQTKWNGIILRHRKTTSVDDRKLAY